jgi:beta-N-acetylhexosaminidase
VRIVAPPDIRERQLHAASLRSPATVKAAIVGLSGPKLHPEEERLLRDHPPAGAILFARNVADPAQLRALTAALRAVLPADAVIAVDQEGGRVARLRPPHWRAHPPAAAIGAAGERAAWLTGALIGFDCTEAGIDLVCAPVLDRRVPGASDVIGDRAFAADPARIAACGAAFAEGVLAAGAMPVAKHAPGHGRALLDSHHALPSVPADADLEPDIAPFRACAALPWMMTAHLLYHGLDSERPGTLSPVVIGDVIRGRIGFQGVLVSDDLAMRALEGRPGDLAASCIAAGCDLALHCSPALDDIAEVLERAPPAGPATIERMRAARARADRSRVDLDPDQLCLERDRLLA